MLIEVKGVNKTYNNGQPLHVLKGIDLSVDKGEFVSIMGASGSGKSTLLNILGILDNYDSGEYRIDGQLIWNLSEKKAAEYRNKLIGFVFQSFNLLPRSTVIRNVMLPLLYTDVAPRDRERRACGALASVGLPAEYFDHRSNELSGGQMQRVAIARALVNDPALVLADEPTGNLDSATSEVVLNTFVRMRDAGKTVVLITHDPEVATWADRCVHIRDGRLLTDEQERAHVMRSESRGRGST